MGMRLGLNCKLFRQEGQSWLEVKNVRDLTLNLEAAETECTTRESDGWEWTAATLKRASVEFQMIWDTNDTHFAAFLAAWLARTPMKMRVLSGVPGQGLEADYAILKVSQGQPLAEFVTADVSIKPTRPAEPPYTAPQWVTVNA